MRIEFGLMFVSAATDSLYSHTPEPMQILFSEICFYLLAGGLAHDPECHQSGSNQRMQVNKMGGQALDEAVSSPPILCLILIVRAAEIVESLRSGSMDRFGLRIFCAEPIRRGL